MIFKLTRSETRPNLNVPFYQYTEEDLSVFSSIPYFLEKVEELDNTELTVKKTFKYNLSESMEELDLIYNNQSLRSLNNKVFVYCQANNIIRGELQGLIEIDGEDVPMAVFPKIP